jgi:hypothetical protein
MAAEEPASPSIPGMEALVAALGPATTHALFSLFEYQIKQITHHLIDSVHACFAPLLEVQQHQIAKLQSQVDALTLGLARRKASVLNQRSTKPSSDAPEQEPTAEDELPRKRHEADSAKLADTEAVLRSHAAECAASYDTPNRMLANNSLILQGLDLASGASGGPAANSGARPERAGGAAPGSPGSPSTSSSSSLLASFKNHAYRMPDGMSLPKLLGKVGPIGAQGRTSFVKAHLLAYRIIVEFADVESRTRTHHLLRAHFLASGSSAFVMDALTAIDKQVQSLPAPHTRPHALADQQRPGRLPCRALHARGAGGAAHFKH